MEDRLYAMMDELGGMDIPLNSPRGNSQNKRLRTRKGDSSADFPADMVLDEPANKNAK
jgi:N-acetylglucosamine-6-sulfatase